MALSAVMQYIVRDVIALTSVAFLAGWMLCSTVKQAVWLGGLGSALPWLSMAFWLDVGNEHILSTRMANLFHLPGYGFTLLITFVLAFVIGLVAAIAGYYFQKFLHSKS